MAFDGFVMNARVTGPERRMEEITDMLCEFILGPADGAVRKDSRFSGAGTRPRSASRRAVAAVEQVVETEEAS
jgi:hypothetical protein